MNCQCKMKLRLIHLWYHYNNLNVTRGSEFLEMERKNKRPRTEPEEEDMDIGNEKQLLSVLIYFLGIIWVFVMEGSGGGIFLIWIRDKFWSFLVNFFNFAQTLFWPNFASVTGGLRSPASAHNKPAEVSRKKTNAADSVVMGSCWCVVHSKMFCFWLFMASAVHKLTRGKSSFGEPHFNEKQSDTL